MDHKKRPLTELKTCFCILLLAFSINSCKRPTHSEYALVPPGKILSSPEDLAQYWNGYMNLSGDFQSYDTLSKSIPNKEFLKLLTSGKYLPLRLSSANDSLYYKLYPIAPTVSSDFGEIVASYTNSYYQNYLRRGQAFPDNKFDYTDLTGKHHYTPQTIKDKTVIIKFWFINCPQCIKEMPKMDSLQEKYKNRNDVLFLSLASDPPDKLKSFLKKQPFDIPVISVKDNYVEDKLKVKSFPTIMVLDKHGSIAQVFDNADDFESVYKNL